MRGLIAIMVVAGFSSGTTLAFAQSGQRVERDGVSVRFAERAQVIEVELQGERFTVQRWRDAMMRLVRTDGLTSAEYLARPIGPWVRTHVRSVQACGVHAQVYELQTQREVRHGMFDSPSGMGCRTSVEPATTTTILLIPRDGMLVRIEWTVQTSRRPSLRRWERKFLRSVRCG